MKYISGQALIDLLELADFELFTLAAAGVIPITTEGISLKSPRYALPAWDYHELLESQRLSHSWSSSMPVEGIIRRPPATWAKMVSGFQVCNPLVRRKLLTALKKATFPVDQLLEHYPSIEREIETQQSKKTDEVANASSATGRASKIDKIAVRAYAKGILESNPDLTRSDLAAKIKEALPEHANYSERNLIEWTQDLFPDYSPLKPGRKKRIPATN